MATEDERYVRVAQVISQYGSPNPMFPKDIDMEYSEMKKHLNAVAGLGTVLKNMKEKHAIHYSDPFIKDGTIVTLVNDYYQEVKSLMVTYEEISDKVSGHLETHAKVAGW